MTIPVNTVVVAGNIHIGKGIPGLPIAEWQRRATLHKFVAQKSRQIIKEFAAHRAGFLGLLSCSAGTFCLLRFFFGLVITVNTKPNGTKEIEKDVHAAGYRAGNIQLVKIIRQRLCQGNAFALSSFTDLVARRIHDHTRMIVVLIHHIPEILLPPSIEKLHIVILGLVDIPVIDVLVHHQNAQLITGIQQCLRTGVVGAADRIVAVFFQQTNLSFLRILPACSAKDAVVMVNARTPENRTLAVYANTVFTPSQAADTKRNRFFISTKPYPERIQVRAVRTPQLHVGKNDVHTDFAVGLLHPALDHRFSVQNIHKDLSGTGGLYGKLHGCGINGKCSNSNTVQQDMFLLCHPQVDRSVNAGAGIPTGIGLVSCP